MYGKYLNWQCLECGHINNDHIGSCSLFQFDGGIRDYDYIEVYCNQCGKTHLVTEAVNIYADDDIVNNFFHLAVVTKEYAEQHNIEERGFAFY